MNQFSYDRQSLMSSPRFVVLDPFSGTHSHSAKDNTYWADSFLAIIINIEQLNDSKDVHPLHSVLIDHANWIPLIN